MRFLVFFRTGRFWGLTAVALAGYLIFFVLLGKTDVSWMLPNKKLAETLRETWPSMPFFTVEKKPVSTGTETYYTVPTRQLTLQEVAQLTSTNGMSKPTEPK